ncbi:ankyrin repeat-containing domain protein [Xylariaceae sp. FL0662B]|nr:ankyrin repeat-containing domain protein [Xylariaceae sp. FL0662B]
MSPSWASPAMPTTTMFSQWESPRMSTQPIFSPEMAVSSQLHSTVAGIPEVDDPLALTNTNELSLPSNEGQSWWTELDEGVAMCSRDRQHASEPSLSWGSRRTSRSPASPSDDVSMALSSNISVATSNLDADRSSISSNSPCVMRNQTELSHTVGLNRALFLAAKNGHVGVVRALAEGGADLNALDEEGNSALHLAILGKHQDVVSMLLKHHVQRHVPNSDNLTPLTLAAKIGFEEGVRILLHVG